MAFGMTYQYTVNIILLILGFSLLLVGLVGSVVPVVPGPPLGYLGILVIKWSGLGTFTPEFLWLWGGIVAVVTVADFLLPGLMTRLFGGSRAATWGAMIGVFAGIFIMPPYGIILGPFLGALTGEWINNNELNGRAFKAAFGSFLAFILGVGMKLAVGGALIFHGVKSLFA